MRKEVGNSPETRAAWFRHMQATEPICFHADYDIWEIFSYEDVRRVLLDFETYSAEYVRIEGLPDVDDLGNTDPPRHRELRNIISKAFTPRTVAQLELRITEAVDALLDRVEAQGHFDIAEQLGFPLPVQMIASLLGVPLEDREKFHRWSYQLMGALPNPNDPNYMELTAYFRTLLEQRENHPADDLISALLAAEFEGNTLTRDEVIGLCSTLLFAGHITTSMLINRGTYRFLKQGLFDELRADPALIPNALEEVMRYEFSFSHLLRFVKHDTQLGGKQLKEGQIVLAWTAAANFDEHIFPHGDQFDIRRSFQYPHLTFGYGVHHCLGAPVARLEGKITFERIVARLKDIHIDAQHPVRYMGTTDFIQNLPLFFTPIALV